MLRRLLKEKISEKEQNKLANGQQVEVQREAGCHRRFRSASFFISNLCAAENVFFFSRNSLLTTIEKHTYLIDLSQTTHEKLKLIIRKSIQQSAFFFGWVFTSIITHYNATNTRKGSVTPVKATLHIINNISVFLRTKE